MYYTIYNRRNVRLFWVYNIFFRLFRFGVDMSKITTNMMLEIIQNIGGAANIVTVTNCMTRLRLSLVSTESVNQALLKKIPGVLGVVEAEGQLQIILGPGKAQTGADLMNETLQALHSGQIQESVAAPSSDEALPLEAIAAKKKAALKAKQTNPIQVFLAKFATIFTPLIPGFIGAGLLAGLAAVLNQSLVAGVEMPNAHLVQAIAFMRSFSAILFLFLPILVGYNAQKAFGGSGVNGAIVGAFFVSVFNAKGAPVSGLETFFDLAINQKGGVVGALLAAIFGAFVEKKIRKIMPDNLDMILTSFFTLLIVGVVTYVLIMPAAYLLFEGMAWLFDHLNSNPFGAAILSGLFLISVVFGVHQGFVPVYTSLVAKVGYNTLFPILAVAGGGQVGAAIALYVKAKKDSVLRTQIKGAIVPGILGVGEPLIYGVTLPRGKPFITACLGAACGGFFIGFMAWLGYSVGLNTVFGPSGVVSIPLMTSNHATAYFGMIIYTLGLLIAYIAGFFITLMFGTQNVDLE